LSRGLSGYLLRHGTPQTALSHSASKVTKQNCGKAKAAGGRWNPEKQLWFVKYGRIAGTPLEKHIHIDERDK